MKKLKSKSLILNQIIDDADEKLAAIPEFGASGTPIEFTTDYDMYIVLVGLDIFIRDCIKKARR